MKLVILCKAIRDLPLAPSKKNPAVRRHQKPGESMDQYRNRLMTAPHAVRLKSGEVFQGGTHFEAINAAWHALHPDLKMIDHPGEYDKFAQSFYGQNSPHGERGLFSNGKFIPMDDVYKWDRDYGT